MKIAAVSNDGVTISAHFGRAPFYTVVTVAEGRIVSREQRTKPAHHDFSASERATASHGSATHGFDSASQDRHDRMASVIRDCEVLLCGGMGAGAYESLRSAGVQVIVTDVRSIDDAVQRYLAGDLADHPEKLH